MNRPPRPRPRAGGALLAAAVLLGVLFGAAMREASLGFLAGLAIGLLLLAAIWWIDRRRAP
jgi:hypothetical protein